MNYNKYKQYIQLGGLLIFVLALNILLVLFERNAENSSIHDFADALWYMIVSLTTVGYGDKYPVTTGGQLIGYIFVFGSIGLIGFFIGKFTTIFSDIVEKKKLGYFGTDMEGHVVIIGWNDFSHKVAEQIILAEKKLAVVTNSKNDIDLINDLFGEKVFALFADFENYEALKKVNIVKAASVFVNFNDDTKSLVYVLNVKKLYNEIDFIVSLNTPKLKDTFQSAGVKNAISKDEIASRLVASYIFEPDVAEITDELMSTSGMASEYDIMEYKVLAQNPFCNIGYNKVFAELKEKYNVILIGIAQLTPTGYVLLKNPSESVMVREGDYLVMMGGGDRKRDLAADFQVGEGRFK